MYCTVGYWVTVFPLLNELWYSITDSIVVAICDTQSIFMFWLTYQLNLKVGITPYKPDRHFHSINLTVYPRTAYLSRPAPPEVLWRNYLETTFRTRFHWLHDVLQAWEITFSFCVSSVKINIHRPESLSCKPVRDIQESAVASFDI